MTFALPAATPLSPTLELLKIQVDPGVELGRLTSLQLLLALGLKARLGFGQSVAALISTTQPGRWLITTVIAVALVLVMVSLLGVCEQLFDDRDIGAPAIPRRVRSDLGAVNCDHPDPDQPGLGAQRQDLHEHLADRVLMATAKLRNRRVIRHSHRGDHLKRHIDLTATLDLT